MIWKHDRCLLLSALLSATATDTGEINPFMGDAHAINHTRQVFLAIYTIFIVTLPVWGLYGPSLTSLWLQVMTNCSYVIHSAICVKGIANVNIDASIRTCVKIETLPIIKMYICGNVSFLSAIAVTVLCIIKINLASSARLQKFFAYEIYGKRMC